MKIKDCNIDEDNNYFFEIIKTASYVKIKNDNSEDLILKGAVKYYIITISKLKKYEDEIHISIKHKYLDIENVYVFEENKLDLNKLKIYTLKELFIKDIEPWEI